MSLDKLVFAVIAGLFSFGIALTLIGAAEALDTPKAPVAAAAGKGDRLADPAADARVLTVEEVNLDIGVSNLIRIERTATDD